MADVADLVGAPIRIGEKVDYQGAMSVDEGTLTLVSGSAHWKLYRPDGTMEAEGDIADGLVDVSTAGSLKAQKEFDTSGLDPDTDTGVWTGEITISGKDDNNDTDTRVSRTLIPVRA